MVSEYITCTLCDGTGRTQDYSQAKDSDGNYITPPKTDCIGCGGAGTRRNPSYEAELAIERKKPGPQKKEKKKQKRKKEKSKNNGFRTLLLALLVIFIIALFSDEDNSSTTEPPSYTRPLEKEHTENTLGSRVRLGVVESKNYEQLLNQVLDGKLGLERSDCPIARVSFSRSQINSSLQEFSLSGKTGGSLWYFALIYIKSGDLDGDGKDDTLIELASSGGGCGGNVEWAEYFVLSSKGHKQFKRLRASNHKTIINPPKNDAGAYASLDSISNGLLVGKVHFGISPDKTKREVTWEVKDAKFKLLKSMKLELVEFN